MPKSTSSTSSAFQQLQFETRIKFPAWRATPAGSHSQAPLPGVLAAAAPADIYISGGLAKRGVRFGLQRRPYPLSLGPEGGVVFQVKDMDHLMFQRVSDFVRENLVVFSTDPDQPPFRQV